MSKIITINGAQHRIEDAPHGNYSYSHKPSPIFRSIISPPASGEPYYGIELEMDDGASSSFFEQLYREIPDVEQYFYPKNDGSLSSRGVELVSHPWSWKYWSEGEGLALISRATGLARAAGFTSHDNKRCGLHVHVSKSPYMRNWGRILPRLYVITSSLWDQIKIFTRRNKEKLNAYSAPPIAELQAIHFNEGSKDWKDAVLKTVPKGVRNLAVNDGNSSTVEFRMFRGSLAVDTILASIAFCASLIKVAEGDIPLRDVNMSTILKAIESKELLGYCLKKKLTFSDINRASEYEENDPDDSDKLEPFSIVCIGF